MDASKHYLGDVAEVVFLTAVPPDQGLDVLGPPPPWGGGKSAHVFCKGAN